MGTLVHVSASGPPHELERAIDAAFAAVDEVERLMSFHDPQSELSRINRDAARAPVTVHAWTLAVLRRAVRVSAASAGLFDIATAPLLVNAGLLPGSSEALHRHGDWRHVMLLPNRKIFLGRPMQLDLGGIAKGFAVDRAIHELRRRGCTAGAVNAGGDLRRFGPIAHPVHLRRHNGLVAVAELRCGAIATSEPRMKHAGRLAQPVGCIFDPRTRQPWESGGAVMVAAPSCVMADALTKVAALAGPDCSPLLSRFGARAMWGT
jgi:thiamine biosynthesis lipoprotein